MANLKYLTKSCDQPGNALYIACLPSDFQIGDTYTQTVNYWEFPDPPQDEEGNWLPPISVQDTTPRKFIYAKSNEECQTFYEQNPNAFPEPPVVKVNNMNPCPRCCNKPNLTPWDLYNLVNGELQPNFPETMVASGTTYNKPTDQDYENAGCVRRCQDRATIDSPGPLTPQGNTIPGKEGGIEIQQKKERKPGDPQTYLYESFKKRLQKLAGIKKSKK
tara:strand:+ start:59 stop:712 length:654 start_codon:yes stop_codon:yes gene_type:complete